MESLGGGMVDAHDSKSCDRKVVGVQVSPEAQKEGLQSPSFFILDGRLEVNERLVLNAKAFNTRQKIRMIF